MKRCIICKEPLPRSHTGRRHRWDKTVCGATCRKRLQRIKATGRIPRTLLPGQLQLPLTSDVTALGSIQPNRQPQDAPGSRRNQQPDP